MRVAVILGVACFGLYSPNAFGQSMSTGENSAKPNLCTQYLGQIVQAQSFETIPSLVSGAAVQKDEFETTEAYEARRTKAAANIPSKLIVKYVPDRKHLRYDADSGALFVSSYFFDNQNTDYSVVFRDSASPRSFNNIDVVVKEEERVVDSYSGTNSYGARVQVSKIQRDTSAIWDRAVQSGENLFPNESKGAESEIGKIPMAAEQAKAMKSVSSAALVIAPKLPYFAYGNKKYAPRFDRPTDINNDIFVVVADIQCALLLDAGNTVQGVWATR